ncbi:unnamed protein product, partial [Protopolystoma xenopodis]
SAQIVCARPKGTPNYPDDATRTQSDFAAGVTPFAQPTGFEPGLDGFALKLAQPPSHSCGWGAKAPPIPACEWINDAYTIAEPDVWRQLSGTDRPVLEASLATDCAGRWRPVELVRLSGQLGLHNRWGDFLARCNGE